MRPRKEPQRTCVGCRAVSDKRALLRVVREPTGRVAVDPTGRAPGRGAYLHPDPGCVATAARRGALGRTLRVALGPEQAASLMREIAHVMRENA